jgi:hypothetical protein
MARGRAPKLSQSGRTDPETGRPDGEVHSFEGFRAPRASAFKRVGGRWMTTEEFEVLDVTEAERILCWRLTELLRLGFSSDSALVLASHVEVELECARDLVRRGCPLETAFRILL